MSKDLQHLALEVHFESYIDLLTLTNTKNKAHLTLSQFHNIFDFDQRGSARHN